MAGRILLETADIRKVYGMGEIHVAALDGIDIQIEAGEFIAVMGPSGSGKSTLLHILGCLSRPTAGRYLLDGEDVSQLNKRQLAEVRNSKLGFVFQSYNLLPRTSALRNVTLPLLYDRSHRLDRASGEKKARELLDLVGMGDRIHHQPHELSGGQQQRAAIARALINDPVVIIADEPTGNLDSHSGDEVMHLFHALHEKGATIVMVTHNPRVAAAATRVIHLEDGRVASVIRNGSHNS